MEPIEWDDLRPGGSIMRILMTTIVLTVGLIFATTGFAGNEAETATEAAEAVTEETPAVDAAPLDTTVAEPAAIDADEADASETATDAE